MIQFLLLTVLIFTTPKTSGCKSEKKVKIRTDPEKMTQHGCGKSNLDVTKRLLGAGSGDTSWTVYIKLNGTVIKRDHCIGGLIYGDIVVTSSDCVPPMKNNRGKAEKVEPHLLDVYDSTYTTKKDSEHQKRTVTAFIDFQTPYPPVALLLLNEPFDVGEGSKARTICRPTTAINFDHCVVSGLYKRGARTNQVIAIGHVWMQPYDQDICVGNWTGSGIVFFDEHVICAGAVSRRRTDSGLTIGRQDSWGVCDSDLGGALACHDPAQDNWILAGVVTAADKNCVVGSKIKPAVVTLFSYYERSDMNLMDYAIEQLRLRKGQWWS